MGVRGHDEVACAGLVGAIEQGLRVRLSSVECNLFVHQRVIGRDNDHERIDEIGEVILATIEFHPHAGEFRINIGRDEHHVRAGLEQRRRSAFGHWAAADDDTPLAGHSEDDREVCHGALY